MHHESLTLARAAGIPVATAATVTSGCWSMQNILPPTMTRTIHFNEPQCYTSKRNSYDDKILSI
jgi:hypothetical protein